MYAYRIYNEETKMMLQDCEDDGETHAGGRLLHLLQVTILDTRLLSASCTQYPHTIDFLFPFDLDLLRSFLFLLSGKGSYVAGNVT